MRNAMISNNVVGLQEDGLKNIWVDFGYSYVVYDREKDRPINDINSVLVKLNIRPKGSPKSMWTKARTWP